MKHTPGPWIISFTKIPGTPVTVYTIDNVIRESNEEISANQTLIAAAPELLDALKRLLNCTQDDLDDPLTAAQDQAMDAIKKAEGK